jgi:hypothetical protein
MNWLRWPLLRTAYRAGLANAPNMAYRLKPGHMFTASTLAGETFITLSSDGRTLRVYTYAAADGRRLAGRDDDSGRGNTTK